jgi:hypothetical protein
MTADEILKLAGELFASSRPKSEALCRNIIGRSYYAAYHMALSLFADLGLPRSSDHKDASRWLIESGDANGKKAGRALETLYAARRQADYDLTTLAAIENSRDLAFVRDQVEMAAEVKGLLALCAVEPARSQVRAAILAFHQRTRGARGS